MSRRFAAAAPETQAEALAATTAALAPHVVDGVVTLGAATWIVTATKS